MINPQITEPTLNNQISACSIILTFQGLISNNQNYEKIIYYYFDYPDGRKHILTGAYRRTGT